MNPIMKIAKTIFKANITIFHFTYRAWGAGAAYRTIWVAKKGM